MITEKAKIISSRNYWIYSTYLTLIIIPESDKSRMHPLHHETTGKDL